MSREQVTAQEAEQTEVTTDAASAEDVQGLPPRIYRQVIAIKHGPGDAEALADLMGAFDGVFAQRIAAVAARSPHLGNALVQDAIKLSEARAGARGGAQVHAPAPGSANAFDKEEFRRDTAKDDAGATDDLRGLDGGATESLPPGLRAQVMALAPGDAAGLAELLARSPASAHDPILLLARSQLGVSTVAKAVELKQQGGGAQPAAGGASPAGTDGGQGKPAGDPVWASARAYNDHHATLVAEFNELTDDRCRLDGDSKVDAHAVSRWQQHHGLDPDGKIGPRTVAKAREIKASGSQLAAAAPQADARPPV
jgi:hypothetical protein